MPYMSLVKPLLPTHLFELIYAGWSSDLEDDTAYGSAPMLEKLARVLESEEVWTDAHNDLLKACLSLAAQLLQFADIELEAERIYRRNCLQKRLFAARLLKSLWYLRVHNAKEARCALNQGYDIYLQNMSAFEKAVALESLGLVSSLLTELEDRLARFEPCL